MIQRKKILIEIRLSFEYKKDTPLFFSKFHVCLLHVEFNYVAIVWRRVWARYILFKNDTRIYAKLCFHSH